MGEFQLVETLGQAGGWGFACLVVYIAWKVWERHKDRQRHDELVAQNESQNRKLERLTRHLEDKGVITRDPMREVLSEENPITIVGRLPGTVTQFPKSKVKTDPPKEPKPLGPEDKTPDHRGSKP